VKQLRLLVWPNCDRNCPGCCNNDWDLDALPELQVSSLPRYNPIMLTGGEPMLFPVALHRIIRVVRKACRSDIYVYTAKLDDAEAALRVLAAVDGMTVTLHTQADVPAFKRFANRVANYGLDEERRLRLHVFRGVVAPVYSHWSGRLDMVWQRNCPLPKDEVFMKL
jgi:hypothetical protein